MGRYGAIASGRSWTIRTGAIRARKSGLRTGARLPTSAKAETEANDFEKSSKVVAENRTKAVASLDGLKEAMGPVGKACDNCHENYRAPNR